MSNTYLPHQLVHAHLPRPPLTPDAIPELRIPTQRPYPQTSDAYAEPLHPDHAVSVAHDPATGILARSIQNGYGLELRHLSLVVDSDREKGLGGSETIRFSIPDPLRPLGIRCITSPKQSGRVYILVVTQANVLYRLSFPLGSFKPGRGNRVVFTAKGNEDWCEEWVVPEDVVASCGGLGAWTVVNESNVVLGGGDGGIVRLLRLNRGGGQWTAHHHRVTSRFRLPSLFTGNASSTEQVISFALFERDDHQSLLYSLSRDRKLRVWNTSNGACLKTIDVRPMSNDLVLHGSPSSSTQPSAALSDNASAPLIRLVTHPSKSSTYSHITVVFLATPHSSSSPGTFMVYRASQNFDLVSAGERPCSASSAGAQLRSFEIMPPVQKDGLDTGWRLWAIWDNNGTVACESVSMDDLFQFQTYVEPHHPSSLLHDWQRAKQMTEVDQFDAAYFDNLLSLDPPNPAEPYNNSDISSTFITHLFHPGRFSPLTTSTALNEYAQQLPRRHQIPQLSAPYPSVSKKFAAIVGCDVQMETSPRTGAPVVEVFRRDLKLDWLGIWARVRDLDKQARWPVSSTVVDEQLVVLARESVTAPVPLDVVGVLDQAASSSERAEALMNLPEGSLKKVHRALAPPTARNSAVALSTAGALMSSTLTSHEAEEGGTSLEAFVYQVNTYLATPASQPVESLAGRLWDDQIDPNLSNQDRTAIRRLLSECPDIMRGLADSLDLLADLNSTLENKSNPDLGISGLGNSLIASTISSIISARYSLARNILLVSLFHLAESADEEAEDLVETLARAMFTYHRYRVLNWITEQTGEEAQTWNKGKHPNKRKANGGDEMLADGLGGLKMREGEMLSTDTDGYDLGYSLVHSLLARRTPQEFEENSVNVVCGAAVHYLAKTALVSRDQVDIDPQASDVKLAYTILVDGHAALAGQMSALYPLSSGMAYVRGRAYLEVGDVDLAVRNLQQAAAGCKDGSLSIIIPACTGDTEYYRHLTRLFDKHSCDGPVAYFGQLAIDSASPDDPSVHDLWTRVFLADLAMGSHEEAYSVLSSCPHLDLQKDFLGQLISVMCESNEVGRLNSLGFVGFQKEVEATLSFKARNSDPLRFPNYYKVLYSWHISRGDYRSAGEIMYRQGRRFAEAPSAKVPAFEIAAMQARSYLAAINALSLVDKRNAWVSGAPAPLRALRGTQGTKRRRVSSYIPKDEFSQFKGPIEIVKLSDIEAEYTLVLSQLQLSSRIRDLHELGISVSPHEVVGLFTQRGMFDHAQSAAASLQVDMTDMFHSLAARCVELSRMSDIGGDPSTASFLQTSPLTSRLRGPPSALALRYLQSSLSRHDSPRTQWKYREAVANTLFEMNLDKKGGWQMPVWLVDWEMERDSEGWIRRALGWGWVEEALNWTADLLRRATPPELIPPGKTLVANIPYNLVDRVLAAVGEGDEKDDQRVQRKAEDLREAIARRKEGLAKVRRTS